MKKKQNKNDVQKYSALDVAQQHLHSSINMIHISLMMPVPLMVGAVLGFFYFESNWFKDPFLWAILGLFIFGQLGAFLQYLSLRSGAVKAGKTISIIKSEGETPNFDSLQQKMLKDAPPCQIRDSVLRWIQLGIQGESQGMERMMDHAAIRRDQVANKLLSFHSSINRITLKMGFLGTLMGLLMAFEPMKQAMLSLQGSQGEFKFINDIVKAIDGDAYAILTTLFATGLSIFIELLTIQLFERVLGQFELMNNNLDDWCLIHLQPRIKEYSANAEKRYLEELIKVQKDFAEKVVVLSIAMDEQVRALGSRIEETGRQLMKILPVEKEMTRKVSMLAEYEMQYRQLLNAKLQSLAPLGLTEGQENDQ